MPTLDEIPDEIIHQILTYITPEDNLLRVQLLSRRLNALANEPLLWRQHCRTSFKFWRPEHNLSAKLGGRVSDVDWKALFLLRKTQDVRIANLFDGILATKQGQMRRFEQICLLGYDAKDFLLEQCRTIDSADDVLARRYFSNEILASLRRGQAVEVWREIAEAEMGRDTTERSSPRDSHPPDDVNDSEAEAVPSSPTMAAQPANSIPLRSPPRMLERGLSALDMFLIPDDDGDIDNTTQLLDILFDEFVSSHANLDTISIREKALALNRWVHVKDLVGMDNPEESHRHLDNCFLGRALRAEGHPSFPIVSAAIFCALAERLGLNVHCIPAPGRVHVVIYAPLGVGLDGDDIDTSSDPPPPEGESMFLDPYSSDREVSKENLMQIVSELSWQSSSAVLLEPAPISLLVQRAAGNIRSLVGSPIDLLTRGRASGFLVQGHPSDRRVLATYAAAWAGLVFSRVDPMLGRPVEDIFRRFSLWYRPDDSWLIREHFAFITARVNNLYDIRAKANELLAPRDEELPEPRRRTSPLRYSVGQVVQHRRHPDYLGVIVGWTTVRDSCYHCTVLSPENSYNIVSREDQLTLVTDPNLVDAAPLESTGLYFKRFDRSTCRFVSNIQEFYPDG